MAWLFHEATRNLLTSEGWRVFDKDVDITHTEIEERVDMESLADEFESWLDRRLNEIDKSTPVVKPVGLEFHKPEDCPRRVLVEEADAEFPNEYHHGECDMPKCICTHYNDDRDHWGGCPYSGQRIPRSQVQTHAMLIGEG